MRSEVQRARSAQQAWSATAVAQRVKLLRRLRQAIASRVDEIVATVFREIGKPATDALTGDVMVTLEALRFYERHAAEALRPRRVGQPALMFSGAAFTESYQPHGVALVIAPWNYPFQLAMVPAITALVAGNTVVLKASERAPHTAALMTSLFHDAGFSDGVVQVVSASPAETEAMIAERPDILFFTGSSGNGRRVAQQAAALLIPTVLELGGKDACLVFASCDLPRAVDGVCYGAFSNAGQVCVGVKRLYVQRSLADAFLPAFITRATQLRIGTGIEADMGEVRFDFLRTLLAEQVDDALARGATLHTPWDRSAAGVPPIIVTDVPADARLMAEESFGPVVCIGTFDTEAEAIALANDSPFALSSSVFTGDRAQGQRVAAAMRAGSCTVNDCIRSVGNPYASFGGNNGSGHGRYHGVAGLRAFTRATTVMTVNRPRRHEAHWFPFTLSTYRVVRGFLILRHSFRTPFQALRRSLQRIP